MQAAATARETPASAEHELKFVLPAAAAGAMREWLRARCLPDPQYPGGIVSSIYYDGRNLRYLNAKINSDFEKTKVRLRWYSDRLSGRPVGTAFLEVKRKVGARRMKTRLPLETSAIKLAAGSLSNALFRDILAVAPGHGIGLPTDLLPVMEIGFRRHRFVEPTSGARVSIDSEIRAVRTNPMMLPGMNPFPLAHAVLESKGELRELPNPLLPLTAMGCSKESFSKYERCYRKVLRRSSF